MTLTVNVSYGCVDCQYLTLNHFKKFDSVIDTWYILKQSVYLMPKSFD